MSVIVRVRDGNLVAQFLHGRYVMKIKDDRLGQRMHRLSKSRDTWKQRVVEKPALIR